jgi:outer membrane protein assembly factor BamB
MKTNTHLSRIRPVNHEILEVATHAASHGRLWAILWLTLWLLGLGVCGNLRAAPGDKKWAFQTGGSVWSCPAIGADGTVYLGSFNQNVYALDGATGQKKWAFRTGGSVRSSPAIGADGTVYVGSFDNQVYALDGATGQKKWQYLTGDYVDASPAISADGTIYVGSRNGKLYALDGATGQEKWEFLCEESMFRGIDSSPAIGGDGTVYFGSWNREVYALYGATGQKKWDFMTGSEVHSSPAVGSDGAIYIGSRDDRLFALDGKTGRKRWECGVLLLSDSSPAVGVGGLVYVGSQDKKLYAVDGATGQKQWEFLTGDMVTSCPAIGADGTVYVGSNDQKLYALDGATGHKQWEFKTGWFVSSPAIGADGTVYVGSADGNVYALVGSSSGGLANSAWPKFRANARNTAMVQLAGPPRINEEPADSRIAVGSTNRIGVLAEGALPLSYQWYFQDRVMPQATNNVLVWSGVELGQGGDYSVTISNALGMVTSQVARVVVGYALSVSRDGQAGSVHLNPDQAVYDAGSRVELRAEAFSGHTFQRWSGDLTVSDNPLFLTMDSNKKLVAEFALDTTVLKWVFATQGPIETCPAIGTDGTVFIVSKDGRLYALDGATGTNKWQFNTGGLSSLAVIFINLLVVGAANTVYLGYVVFQPISPFGGAQPFLTIGVFEGASGRQQRTLGGGMGPLTLGLALGANNILYGAWAYYDRISMQWTSVSAWDAPTGGSKWTFKLPIEQSFCTAPAVGAGGIAYFGASGMSSGVYAVDGASGQQRWHCEAGQVQCPPALGLDDKVYVGSENQRFYALEGATGQEIWDFPTGGAIRLAPIVGFNTVYVASEEGKLYALATLTGAKQWESMIGSTAATPALGADGTLYVALTDGKVLALDSRSGIQTGQFVIGARISCAPALGADGTLYVGSTNGNLYAFATRSSGGLANSPWPKDRGNAQNTARVQVPALALRFQSFQFSTNSFNLLIQGPAGQSGWLDATTNFQTWTPLALLTNTTGGFQFTDRESVRLPQRFYRLRNPRY